jgi:glycosyltransferase involved in cell wall biosynthesis
MQKADLVIINYILYLSGRPWLMETCESMKDKIILGACSYPDAKKMKDWGHKLNWIDRYSRATFANSMELMQLSGAKYFLPNGVDTSFYVPNYENQKPRDEYFYVGWAGRRTGNKGLDIIQRATQSLSNIRLKVATPDSVKGALTWHEMVDFYNGLDVYINASGTEGTPNPLLEASACGVPVISTKVGVVPEFVIHETNGLIVQRSSESIADAIMYFKEQPDKIMEMGNAARAQAEAWDWEYMAENWYSMFEDLT